jgi:predicted RNase H-like HicB family nuclease
MTYYCTITKQGNKFLTIFPDFPELIALNSSQEKALVTAKQTLESYLKKELSHSHAVKEPVHKKGIPVRIENSISIAIQLRNIRGEQTMRKVAEIIGFKYQAYQRLENPKGQSPSIKTLEKFAAAYGCEVNVQITKKAD